MNGNVKLEQAACGGSQWRIGTTFFKCFLFVKISHATMMRETLTASFQNIDAVSKQLLTEVKICGVAGEKKTERDDTVCRVSRICSTLLYNIGRVASRGRAAQIIYSADAASCRNS